MRGFLLARQKFQDRLPGAHLDTVLAWSSAFRRAGRSEAFCRLKAELQTADSPPGAPVFGTATARHPQSGCVGCVMARKSNCGRERRALIRLNSNGLRG